MLERLRTVFVSALFGAWILAYGHEAWLASQQDPPHKYEQPSSKKDYKSIFGNLWIGSHSSNADDKRQQETYWYDKLIEHAPEWLLAFITAGLVLLGLHQLSTTKRELRAYVFLKVMHQELSQTDFDVLFRFENHGKTPAVVSEIRYRIDCWGSEPRKLSYIKGSKDYERIAGDLVITGNSQWPETNDDPQKGLRCAGAFANIQRIKDGADFLFFHGQLTYKDIFRRKWITPFLWRYEGATGEFRPCGSPKHNKPT